jgi:hypothetical protein
MEKIDRELLIKEISARLPYGVKAKVYGWDKEKGEVEVPLRIYSINTDGYVYFETNDYDVNYLNVDNCLLYLRPMYSMTEEEEVLFRCELPAIAKTDAQLVTMRMELFLKGHLDFNHLIEKGLALEAPDGMY